MSKDKSGTDSGADAAARKASAEARVAELDLQKREREARDADSPSARARREAEDRKATDEAQLGSAEARQKQVAALVPDLSKVTSGSLEVKGETSLFGPSLAQRATVAAAVRIAERAGAAIASPDSTRVLVTSDSQLATSDAIYLEVLSGLDQLITAADGLLAESAPDGVKTKESFVGAAAVAGAIAQALPSALSLISAHRTLSTSTDSVDSLAAAAVVAGELRRRPHHPSVSHDDFRTLPEKGVLQERVASVADRRQRLNTLKATLGRQSSTETAHLGELKEAAKKLGEELAKAEKGAEAALRSELEQREGEVETTEAAIEDLATRSGQIDSVVAAIDAFTTSMRTTADGADHSPIAAATLREQLHATDPARPEATFTHVLLVKAEPGSAQQLIDDRPFLFKDAFSAIATCNVTYILIETAGGSVVTAGSVGGEAHATGKVGGDFTVTAKSMSATG